VTSQINFNSEGSISKSQPRIEARGQSSYSASQSSNLPVDGGGAATGLEQFFELAAMGPVESIVLKEDGSAAISILGQSFEASTLDRGLAVGDYVFAGSVDGNSLALLAPVADEYILGVSEVFLVGSVDSVQRETAHFTIGDASFDYAYLLSEFPQFTLTPGEFVEVAGYQAVRGGSVLLGIHGSGIRTGFLQGIDGRGVGSSSLQGIHGSGIGSSFTQGIHGSGIGSSFTQGIHGSGIGSSFTQGIHGSGIGSSFTQGIHGSGIGSSFTQGIHGSGILQ
jgi:hypothetical protein